MRIYLAGPITGKGYDEVVSSIAKRADAIKVLGFEVMRPMMGKEALRNEERFSASGYKTPVASDHGIFERDQWMVRTCDIVFADLSSAERVSIGTMYELAWASLLGKHTVVVMPDDGPHQHTFVVESADIVFKTTDEAIEYLKKLGG